MFSSQGINFSFFSVIWAVPQLGPQGLTAVHSPLDLSFLIYATYPLVPFKCDV